VHSVVTNVLVATSVLVVVTSGLVATSVLVVVTNVLVATNVLLVGNVSRGFHRILHFT